MDGYLYQYLLGLPIFAAGVWVGLRSGLLGLRGRPLARLALVLALLALFAAGQGWLQYADMGAAEAKPYAGGFERRAVLGTPLDYAIMIGYFLAILAIGTWFGRRQTSLDDFFFAGRRFSWGWITLSLVATLVGSYSFVKYSQVGFRYGLGSSQSYLNDWIWLPLLVFGWLPILYLSRVTSVPEYFERRFDHRVRRWVTIYVLIYLIGYVAVNLFTMGRVLNALVGWPVWPAAALVAAISAVYVTAGGQTSVIMTDLFQGLMLLVTGLLLLWLGIEHLGGAGQFWAHLPRGHRLAFPVFNSDPAFPSVGIFWQDAIANSAMFYFMHQGIIMRFLSARSVTEGRKAMFATVLVLVPVAAVVVSGGGWVARALVHSGALPPDVSSAEAFFVAAELLSRPGVFGLVLAALTAALMSTVDTLITGVAAIVVNDVYKPLVLAARGRSPDGRVAGAMGSDARRHDAGDAGPSSRRGNAADGPMPPATRRATRDLGPPAALLVVDDGPASTPLRALHANQEPSSRDHPDSYRGLLGAADERELLKVARLTAVGVTLLGVLLVPVFLEFRTIYEAHGAFTAAVTPPLVITLLLAVFWKRFTAVAARVTLVGGMAAIVLSLFVPEIIAPFAHGVPMAEAGSGLLAGMSQYKYMRAFFGIAVCAALAVGTTFFTRPEPPERRRGLVAGEATGYETPE